MIEARHITYQKGKKILLDDLTISFAPGKLNLVLGPNGAGKSTLIRIVSGFLRPTSGSVFLEGRDIQTISIHKMAKFRGVLSQQIELAFPMTVRDIVMMGRYPHFQLNPSVYDQMICDQAIQYFEIEAFLDRNYMTLSGGEKQRVQFARVYAQVLGHEGQETKYLLLDEPLTFLDVYFQYDLMDKIVQMLKQMNIVVVGVVHDLHLAAKYADEILLLHHGRLFSSGKKEDVLTVENIRHVFGIDSKVEYRDGEMKLELNSIKH